MEVLAIYGVIFLFYIPFIVLGIICIVLSIKLMKRGITALDRYIEENS